MLFSAGHLGISNSSQVWMLLEGVLVPESHTTLIKSSLDPTDLPDPITRPHL